MLAAHGDERVHARAAVDFGALAPLHHRPHELAACAWQLHFRVDMAHKFGFCTRAIPTIMLPTKCLYTSSTLRETDCVEAVLQLWRAGELLTHLRDLRRHPLKHLALHTLETRIWHAHRHATTTARTWSLALPKKELETSAMVPSPVATLCTYTPAHAARRCVIMCGHKPACGWVL